MFKMTFNSIYSSMAVLVSLLQTLLTYYALIINWAFWDFENIPASPRGVKVKSFVIYLVSVYNTKVCLQQVFHKSQL